MTWQCFWVEDTGAVVLALRRFVLSSGDDDRRTCPGPGGYHRASVIIGQEPAHTVDAEGRLRAEDPERFAGDERWPVSCEWCEYRFTDDDQWQVMQERIYLRRDTAEHWRQSELPVGATFDADWSPDDWKNPDDGMAVTVVLPDLCEREHSRRDARSHFWNVDGPAIPGDGTLRPHAWTRHGDPKAVPSTLHVAPSIDSKLSCYHGLLHHGVLSDPI